MEILLFRLDSGEWKQLTPGPVNLIVTENGTVKVGERCLEFEPAARKIVHTAAGWVECESGSDVYGFQFSVETDAVKFLNAASDFCPTPNLEDAALPPKEDDDDVEKKAAGVVRETQSVERLKLESNQSLQFFMMEDDSASVGIDLILTFLDYDDTLLGTISRNASSSTEIHAATYKHGEVILDLKKVARQVRRIVVTATSSSGKRLSEREELRLCVRTDAETPVMEIPFGSGGDCEGYDGIVAVSVERKSSDWEILFHMEKIDGSMQSATIESAIRKLFFEYECRDSIQKYLSRREEERRREVGAEKEKDWEIQISVEKCHAVPPLEASLLWCKVNLKILGENAAAAEELEEWIQIDTTALPEPVKFTVPDETATENVHVRVSLWSSRSTFNNTLIAKSSFPLLYILVDPSYRQFTLPLSLPPDDETAAAASSNPASLVVQLQMTTQASCEERKEREPEEGVVGQLTSVVGWGFGSVRKAIKSTVNYATGVNLN